ncbi:ECF transporter S component [Candidatus Bathyarchaeota archaeon]|nr:ECF transporter S component [Candidatus Bathyarchaeota archaeon]
MNRKKEKNKHNNSQKEVKAEYDYAKYIFYTSCLSFKDMQINSMKVTLIQITLWAVMAALVCVATLLIRIPNPMGGYFNVGDVMVFVSALTFGPVVGGVAGGIGSSLADIIGFPVFAIPTLFIKGAEGFLAGFITNKKSVFRDIFAVIVAGVEMIVGYFIVEIYLWGPEAALLEIPGNIGQIVIGGLIGIPIAVVLRKRLPQIMRS